MSMRYWLECIETAADECGLDLTAAQSKCLAESVRIGHEEYGMAFYSPPSSDRMADIALEYKKKVDKLEHEASCYRECAEEAVRNALRLRPDDNISIGGGGEVYLHGGRLERIL